MHLRLPVLILGGATRKWAGKNGWAGKNEPMHHWLLHQKTINKHGLQWFGNQPWNLKVFKTRSEHFRFGHGWRYRKLKPGNEIQQLWYGTPSWPKNIIGSYGGRTGIYVLDE